MTTLKKFKHPVTSVNRVYKRNYVKVTVFLQHQNAGTLTLHKEEEREFIEMLLEKTSTAFIHANGHVQFFKHDLRPETQLVSEFGTIMTVEELKRINK